MSKKYSLGFVDLLIEITQDIPQSVRNRIYKECYKHEISGIDTYRDWIYDIVGAMEKFMLENGNGPDPVDWDYDIIDTCECYVDMLACMTLKKSYFSFDAKTESTLYVPTSEEIKQWLEDHHKFAGGVGWTEVEYDKRFKRLKEKHKREKAKKKKKD